MESGIKRRLIQTLVLRFLDRNKIQVGVSRSMKPSSFGIESDDQMTLTRE